MLVTCGCWAKSCFILEGDFLAGTSLGLFSWAASVWMNWNWFCLVGFGVTEFRDSSQALVVWISVVLLLSDPGKWPDLSTYSWWLGCWNYQWLVSSSALWWDLQRWWVLEIARGWKLGWQWHLCCVHLTGQQMFHWVTYKMYILQDLSTSDRMWSDMAVQIEDVCASNCSVQSTRAVGMLNCVCFSIEKLFPSTSR